MKNRTIQRDVSLEGIVEILRNDILDGVYPPGKQLKQTEIASIIGVSQGPVREALIRLASEGLVENVPFRGMFVRVLTEKDVQEIYQLRYALESLAIKLALPVIQSDNHLNRLQGFIEQNDQAEQEGDNARAVEMDLAFHRYIIGLSGNERLVSIWNSLLAQSQYALRQLYEIQKASQEKPLAKNHTVILEMLHSRDFIRICQSLEEHMAIASDRLSRMIEDRERLEEVG